MITVPTFEPGMVLDLRFTKDCMPDRVYIDVVYRKPTSIEWMYNVYSEKYSHCVFVRESDLVRRLSRKIAKCYEHEVVKEMYGCGFRFCGNNKTKTAFDRAYNMMNAEYIRHIILAEAVDADGNKPQDQMGLWVQYNNVIDDNGVITSSKCMNKASHFRIK